MPAPDSDCWKIELTVWSKSVPHCIIPVRGLQWLHGDGFRVSPQVLRSTRFRAFSSVCLHCFVCVGHCPLQREIAPMTCYTSQYIVNLFISYTSLFCRHLWSFRIPHTVRALVKTVFAWSIKSAVIVVPKFRSLLPTSVLTHLHTLKRGLKRWQCDGEAACSVVGLWNRGSYIEFSHHSIHYLHLL